MSLTKQLTDGQTDTDQELTPAEQQLAVDTAKRAAWRGAGLNKRQVRNLLAAETSHEFVRRRVMATAGLVFEIKSAEACDKATRFLSNLLDKPDEQVKLEQKLSATHLIAAMGMTQEKLCRGMVRLAEVADEPTKSSSAPQATTVVVQQNTFQGSGLPPVSTKRTTITVPANSGDESDSQ